MLAKPLPDDNGLKVKIGESKVNEVDTDSSKLEQVNFDTKAILDAKVRQLKEKLNNLCSIHQKQQKARSSHANHGSLADDTAMPAPAPPVGLSSPTVTGAIPAGSPPVECAEVWAKHGA